MSSKDKEKTINKFKQFFRAAKTPGGLRERDLSPELERELRPETPIAQRCKALKDLGDVVLTSRIENGSLKKLWDLTKDLIVDNKSTEYRHVTLTFYRKLIQGQYENLTFMREHFFHVIKQHQVPEDLRHRLELLKQLTDNGKDIRFFEEKIGLFMLQWAPEIVEAGLTELYLEMLVNIVKFNAAHLENHIVVGILEHACNLSCNVEDTRIGLQCLQILDAVICYAIFPNETLAICILALCRTVNLVPYCQTAWKIMRNLLGTNSGHEALLTMCRILNDKSLYNDEVLLRGAVFHINMGIWGSNCAVVPILRYSPSTVLISFLNSLESQKIIVTYEVILSIQMMIQKSGKDLAEHTWDVVCNILFAIADNISYYERNDLLRDYILQQQYHETIDKIEKLVQADEISINPEIMYQLIEKIAEHRPEISVLNLIEYRSGKISATRPQWLQILHGFIERFYKISNTNVRVKTVQSLIRIMDSNRASYEEEILERVVIPQFLNVGQEPNLVVRTVVAKALIDFAWHCDTKRCGELLDILEKILNRPFEVIKPTDAVGFQTEAEIQDVITVVEGLIDVFMIKLYRLPSYHAIRIFHMLVGHLELHYQRPKVFENLSCVRYKIFVWILKARANGTYHIGFPDPAKPDTILFSHYLGIDSSLPPHHGIVNQQQLAQQTPQSGEIATHNFTTISIRRGCKTIVLCLEKEQDYAVFQLVLHELPKILQNKALIIGSDIESLASVMLRIFSDRKFPDNMAPKSIKLTSDDFNALMLPAIASLVTYHQYLPMRQQSIIEALKLGIPSRTAGICINTLTIMILEIPEILMRQLPDVLLEMSKMSDTASVAMPVLEFLSILSRLPNHRFTNFVPRQYMYVFAISLPYTKPHRYNHYTVSLAHHVIAGWFLKCRLNIRRNIVSYIIASIQSNFEDVKIPQPVNEDSSNRKRSASLTERGSRGRDRPTIAPQPPNTDLRPKMNENLKTFHMELAETCMDFIARHTFSPCSALPKRLPSAEFLLKDAPSQTWLVGTNLITITTSGCLALPTRNGLCDRCAQMCCATSQTLQKNDTSTPNSSYTPNSPEVIGGAGSSSQRSNDGPPDFAINKRYTKASLQASSGTESGSMDLTSSTSSSSQHHTHQSLDGKTMRQISHDGRFSCSSGSLEALSRRGSNPDPGESRESVQLQQQICACSCTGWAEIFIRRPTGSISWIMRIQNPVENDCLGNDMPVHDLISMFLPSQHGGVFGPEFLKNLPPISPPTTVSISKIVADSKGVTVTLPPPMTTSTETKPSTDDFEQDAAKAVAKVRALKRQEEITSSISSGPIDIPKKMTKHKEPAGSFSDVDADDDDDGDDDDVDVPFDDSDSRARNPVRRVNSSPEMSSNWRNPHLAAKQGGKLQTENLSSTTMLPGDIGAGPSISTTIVNDKDDEIDQLQKKKSFTKVSCEAIPEEIAGSTPPSQSESLKDNQQQSETKLDKEKEQSASSGSVLPPKQHSADDVTQTLAVATSTSTTSLKIPIDLQKVTAKPPQSPAPLSPHPKARNAADRIARQMTSFAPNTNGGGSGSGSGGGSGSDSNGGGGGGGDMPRGRSKTISVVREVVNRNTTTNRSATSFARPRVANPPSISRLGISPNFVFLQLFYTGQLQVTEQPIKVNSENVRALTLLDLIPPFETHKIGVLYVGPGQCNNEMDILRNRFGSVRYVEFLRNLGTLVSLKDAKEHNLFVNMETNGSDGNFTYVWKDDIVQVTFHVATLMPNQEKDPYFTEKKKNIGNDFVSIVYNESGEEYSLNTIKGQFNYACVVVQPLELNSNRIFIRAKDEIAEYISQSEPKIVSDSSAPLLARQLALHANLASLVSQSLKTKNPYASNWLERLRKIKHLRTKLMKEQTSTLGGESSSGDPPAGNSGDVTKMPRPNINDFTKYT